MIFHTNDRKWGHIMVMNINGHYMELIDGYSCEKNKQLSLTKKPAEKAAGAESKVSDGSVPDEMSSTNYFASP